MAASQVNVRVGFLFDDKSLAKVQRSLERSAQRMSQLGNDMSLALSAPLALFGAKAVKAAGDLESLKIALQTTMQAGGRSIEEANAELEKLRILAKNPGLDFKQAVQGSVRLQNVGFSAEKARGILEQLANAITASGGSAQELDGVTRQFSQMIGKGRILQEDLTIIVENMPAISKAMKDAFGTTSADRLREMGVSAEQFIDQITNQFSKLPRATGGIKNALVNAGTSLENFFATVGMEIAKVLDLTGKSDKLSASLENLGKWFTSLDDTTKGVIVKFGLFVIAAGPLIKVIGVMKGIGAEAIAIFRDISKGVVFAGAQLRTLATSFMALNTAMKLTVIGATIAALTAAYFAFSRLTEGMRASEAAAEAVADVNLTASQSIVGQKIEVERLVGVLKNEKSTLDEKKKALDELNKISPQYFGNLKINNSLISDATTAQEEYNKTLIMTAKLEAAKAKLVDIEKAKLEEGAGVGKASTAGTAASYLAVNPVFGAIEQFAMQSRQLNAVEDEFSRQALKNLDAQGKAIADMVTDLEKQVATRKEIKAQDNTNTKNYLANAKEEGKANKKKKEELTELGKILEKLEAQNEQEAKATIGEILRRNAPVEQLGPAAPASNLKELPSTLIQVADNAERLSAIGFGIGQTYTSVGETMKRVFLEVANAQTIAAGTTDAVLGSILQLASQGETSLASFGRAALGAALDVAKAKAIEGIFSAVSSALVNVPFPINLALAAVAAGGAAALFNGLSNKINPPKLAKGGIAYGETLATVGEYPGAKSNPEVIAPLDKLVGIMQSVGGGGDGRLVAEVSGDKLLLIMDRATANRNRIRGY